MKKETGAQLRELASDRGEALRALEGAKQAAEHRQHQLQASTCFYHPYFPAGLMFYFCGNICVMRKSGTKERAFIFMHDPSNHGIPQITGSCSMLMDVALMAMFLHCGCIAAALHVAHVLNVSVHPPTPFTSCCNIRTFDSPRHTTSHKSVTS